MTARPPSETTTSRAAILTLPALCAAATLACGSGDAAPAVTVRDSADVAIVTSTAPVWGPGEGWTVSPEPVLSIGALDGPPEAQLFRVAGASRLDDGTVVVNNRGTIEIRFYGPDGGWLRSVGGPGEGPGEFASIAWFDVVGDTLVVKDGSQNRVTWFTRDGRVLESRAIRSPAGQFGPRGMLGPGRFYETTSTGDPPGFEPGHVVFSTAVVAYREGDAAPDTVLRGPGGEGFLIESVRTINGRTQRGISNVLIPYGGRGLNAFGPDGRIALSDGGDYDIHVLSPDGSRLRVRRPVERRSVNDGDVARWIDDLLADVPDDRRAEPLRRLEEIPPAPLMPTHVDLQFDAAGNLWVENFRPPGDDAARTWSVHDPDGRWLGDVVLPEGLEVHEIGEDYVLGVEEDELGVEFVRIVKLRTGRSAAGG